MTHYYLMVNEWIPNNHSQKVRFDLVRHIETSHQKVGIVARDYEKELNGGVEWSPEEFMRRKETMFNVCAVPFSEAREYNSFDTWPCNQEA